MIVTRTSHYNFDADDISKATDSLVEDENTSNGQAETPTFFGDDKDTLEVKVSFTYTKEEVLTKLIDLHDIGRSIDTVSRSEFEYFGPNSAITGLNVEWKED